jgi:glycerophosphoryl diester phosphodiesterase
MRRLIELGVDGIITDRPDVLTQLLNDWSAG